jgi:hypothetical protein
MRYAFHEGLRCGYVHKWKADYEYNTVIRVLMEAFLQMTFCALLNIVRVSLSHLPLLAYHEHLLRQRLFHRRSHGHGTN